MNKILLTVIVLAMNFGFVFAQYDNPGIAFAKIPWWDKEYLTITSGSRIIVNADMVEYIIGLTGKDRNSSGARKVDNYYYYSVISCPDDIESPVGSVIIEIDGIDAKNMSEEQATRLLCVEKPHKLLLQTTANRKYEATLFDKPRPIWLQAFGFDARTVDWEKRENERDYFADNIKVRVDYDAQWSKFKSFDYEISSEDVLAEKELLEKICAKLEKYGLHRDTKNPDILVTITKNADMSIEYIYVPESQQTVVTGSETTTRYSYTGRYRDSETKYKTKTVTSGGYTHRQATTSFYFEIDLLEASKLGQKTLPLIQQVKCEYVSSREEDFDKLYDEVIKRYQLPISTETDLYVSNTVIRYLYADEDGTCYPLVDFGIVIDDKRVVRGVDKASSVVEKTGLRVGDKIERIEVRKGATIKALYVPYIDKWRFSGSIFVERNGVVQELRFKNCAMLNDEAIYFYQYR